MLVRFKVKPTNRTQPPASLDRDLCAVARLLWRTDPREHLAAIALELGAITADDYAMVHMAARMGVLDDLTTEVGRLAWAILARWWPGDDDVQN